MEAEVKAKYPQSNIKLMESSGGVFDVKCDGTLIYSKHRIEGHRFPVEGEITELIEGNKG